MANPNQTIRDKLVREYREDMDKRINAIRERIEGLEREILRYRENIEIRRSEQAELMLMEDELRRIKRDIGA